MTTNRPTWRAAVTNRGFVLHYLQMVAAMFAGMLVLMPLSMMFGDGGSVELRALLMATWMTAGMVAWMAWRRHRWPGIAEMALAMYLSFAVLFPLYWSELLGEVGLMVGGHVLMFPAMAYAMLRRREDHLSYAGAAAAGS